MREFDGREVLRSPEPAERVLALLCGSPDPAATVGEVLRSWSGLPRKELADLLEKLIIVVGLRRLDRVLEREVENMPIGEEVLVENEFLRNWGERLMKRGLERGRDEGVRRTLLRQIERRFGSVPSWAEDSVNAASADAVEQWVLRVIDAPSIEELLR